ncbi:MAG: hypothetical protein HKL96_03875 [Phycisphaerales bacterium]|nr:hypothetical protein [Phycisphaerales bacterium]
MHQATLLQAIIPLTCSILLLIYIPRQMRHAKRRGTLTPSARRWFRAGIAASAIALAGTLTLIFLPASVTGAQTNPITLAAVQNNRPMIQQYRNIFAIGIALAGLITTTLLVSLLTSPRSGLLEAGESETPAHRTARMRAIALATGCTGFILIMLMLLLFPRLMLQL